MKLVSSLLLAVGLLLSSCGGNESQAQERVPAPRVAIPTQLLGLQVAPEDVSAQVKGIERSYLNSVGMFSFREDDLLRATLQVGRFNNAARPQSASFRRSIIGLIGSSKPQELRLGDVMVSSTSGTEQDVYVWFSDNGLFVLSVHTDYEFPRTLLRKIVDLGIDL